MAAAIIVGLQSLGLFSIMANLNEIVIWIVAFLIGTGTTLITRGLFRRRDASTESGLTAQYDGLFDEVERRYDILDLKFNIKSTTSWFELGVRDSRKMTIQETDMTKGKMRSLEPAADLAGQYFHVTAESAKLEATITTTFEVYGASFIIVFLRKADNGKLIVQILNSKGEKIGEPYPYSRYRYPRNHVEFGRYLT